MACFVGEGELAGDTASRQNMRRYGLQRASDSRPGPLRNFARRCALTDGDYDVLVLARAAGAAGPLTLDS